MKSYIVRISNNYGEIRQVVVRARTAAAADLLLRLFCHKIEPIARRVVVLCKKLGKKTDKVKLRPSAILLK